MRNKHDESTDASNLSKFSNSCPSLCPIILIDQQQNYNQQSHEQDSSDPDLLANCSSHSSPTHFPSLPSNSQAIDRRRSWTDLEDSRQKQKRLTVDQNNHLQAQNIVRMLKHIL